MWKTEWLYTVESTPKWIFLLALPAISYLLWKLLGTSSSPKGVKSLKDIPYPQGANPLIGHGIWAFRQDFGEFLRSCYEVHGMVFKLKIFGKIVAFVADPVLVQEVYAAKEEELSSNPLSKEIQELPFFDVIKVIRHTAIAGAGRKFLDNNVLATETETMIGEANMLVSRIKEQLKKSKGDLDITQYILHYVLGCFTRCLLKLRIDDKTMEELAKVSFVGNWALDLSFFFPGWVVREAGRFLLKFFPSHTISWLSPSLENYRKDPKLQESYLLRKAADCISPRTGQPFCIPDLVKGIVFEVYLNAWDTTDALLNTYLDIVQHPKVKEAVESEVVTPEWSEAIESPQLQACLLESARVHTLPRVSERKVVDKKSLGGYDLTGIDLVTVCGELLHLHPSYGAEREAYQPNRYLESEKNETAGPISWGLGSKRCPGEIFSQRVIKVAVIAMLKAFQVQNEGGVRILWKTIRPKSTFYGKVHALQLEEKGT